MKVIVIGGGPAGMMAAGTAAKGGADVVLLEKNEKLGKKLYITGKGRCNVTNTDNKTEFMDNIISNPKFMYAALNSFDTQSTYDFFEDLGVDLKIERGGRVFPQSDKASDITDALKKYMRQNHVEIILDTEVKNISKNQEKFNIKTSAGDFNSDIVIIACGGLTYPLTGSTGDGYRFAKDFGHNITKLSPSLCGLKTKEIYPLMGLTLKNISVELIIDNKTCATEFGELLFTHEGVSGPTILTLSAYMAKKECKSVNINIDLKPALDYKTLDERVQRDFKKYSNKQLKNALNELLPQSLIPVIIKLSTVNEDKIVNSITVEERKKLINTIKCFSFTIIGNTGMESAIITSGGISIKEINPKTMESKIVEHLYFAGECIDVDALTGGYNIQIALSTGYLAGKSAACDYNL